MAKGGKADEAAGADLLTLSPADLDKIIQGKLDRMIALGTVPSSAGVVPIKGTLKREDLYYDRRATADYIFEEELEPARWREIVDAHAAMEPGERNVMIAERAAAYSRVSDLRLRRKLMAQLRTIP